MAPRGATSKLLALSLCLLLTVPAAALREALVEVDFSRAEGKVILRLGATLHANWMQATASREVQRALRDLKLEYLRLPTGQELGPFAGPAPGLMDVRNLVYTAGFSKAIGAKPLICMRTQPNWQLTPSEFAAYCQATAESLRRAGVEGAAFEILEAPETGPHPLPLEKVVEYLNRARKAILEAMPKAEVGGPGLSAPWREKIELVLEKVRALDFLSFHFFGTHNATTSSERLFFAAREVLAADLPDQLSPAEVRAALLTSGHVKTKLFITRLNVNSILTPDGGPRDPRVSSGFCAAWLAGLLPNIAREVDCAFYYDVAHKGWGLLKGEKKSPAYHALWLFSTYFPRGSVVSHVEARDAPEPFPPFAVRTKTAGNVLLVNPSNEPLRFVVSAHGLKVRRARLRLYQAAKNQIQFISLPSSPLQRLILRPRDVAVLQFIPSPPKGQRRVR